MRISASIILWLFLAMNYHAYAVELPLFVDNPVDLQRLMANGFAFESLTFAATTISQNNAELYKSSQSYQYIVESLTQDLVALQKSDAKLAVGMKATHRLFDSRWLQSSDAFFELVGVVNRLDRASFKTGSCGELRFIYRLAYQKTQPTHIYSRLPMTVNVVFWADAVESCQAFVKQWEDFVVALDKKDVKPNTEMLGLQTKSLKSIEINLQAVRWPSTIRPDMGGYAEYFLRVFKYETGKLQLATLENTPDIKKIQNDPALKQKLLQWLSDVTQLAAIDQGVVNIPDEFLAKKATSVALNGVHRLANAPFTQLFSEVELATIDYKNKKTFQTPHGLLRRLNDFSCVGCHQGRTIAGFHFLGKDHPDTDAVNAIYTSFSPHFFVDQRRRIKFYQSVERKHEPEAFRSISVRDEIESGNFGAHCGLGDSSFASWQCAEGFECQQPIIDRLVSQTGVCMPKKPIAGSNCAPGKMLSNPHPHRDRVALHDAIDCRSGQFCEGVRVGFPSGMCSGSCRDLQAGEICGSIAILKGFNDCLARGKEPFATCLSENVRPGALKACSDTEPCRDDYICARTLEAKGGCIPPYFLFQLRVDGHPEP